MQVGPVTSPIPPRSDGVLTPQELPIPPESLRHRVHGAADVESFLKVGENCGDDIRQALAGIDRPLESFDRVMDFGCGCGRTLRYFAELSSQVKFFGTDIDAEAIAWCTENIPYARFGTNQALPPLEFRGEFFDLIYAVSVFSHLDEQFQFAWLEELNRLVTPGGVVLASVHGRQNTAHLPAEYLALYEANGFLYASTGVPNGVFPVWYQTAFHTPEYVHREFDRYFEVVDYSVRGMNNHQDLIVLVKRR